MPQFSKALLAIYRESTRGSLHDFRAAAARILHGCVDFDAIVLGASRFYAMPGLFIISAHVDGRPQSLINDYLPLLSDDPLMRSLLAGLERPLAADLATFYPSLGLDNLAALAQQYRLRHMLAFSDPPHAGHARRWMIVYKDGRQRFSSAQRQRLSALWPHVSQATTMCDAHARLLGSFVAARVASAVLNSCGEIAFADLGFLQLLRLECPEGDLPTVVRRVEEHLFQERCFKGGCIEVTLVPGSQTVCQASLVLPAENTITPRERLVAQRFAAGLSHKEVARELGISPHTVRTQLVRVYAKLQLHDKGALANYLAAHDAGMSAAPPH